MVGNLTVDIKTELDAFAKAMTDVATKGPIKAFCIIASGNDAADEKAYWQAVRLGAQWCEFWIVGDSPRIRQVDTDWGKVTKWILSVTDIPTGHVVKIVPEQTAV